MHVSKQQATRTILYARKPRSDTFLSKGGLRPLYQEWISRVGWDQDKSIQDQLTSGCTEGTDALLGTI